MDKFAERPAQLAESTLQTLAELGYARTSLREIAHNSEFSHGVLHYYFADKVDLLTHCVRQFEETCVTRYDDIVARARTAADLEKDFAAAMAATLRTDARMHRPWYDQGNQSLFEEFFRADVLEIDHRRQEMIWHVITRYAELADTPAGVSPPVGYALFDGLFQQALLNFLAGNENVADTLEQDVPNILTQMVRGPVTRPHLNAFPWSTRSVLTPSTHHQHHPAGPTARRGISPAPSGCPHHRIDPLSSSTLFTDTTTKPMARFVRSGGAQ